MRASRTKITRRPRATVQEVLVAALLGVTVGGCASPVPPDAASGPGPVEATGAAPGASAPIPPASSRSAPSPSALSPSAATATALVRAVLPQLEISLGREGTAPGELMLPVDVAVDGDGDLYVTDTSGVQKLAPDGRQLARIGADDLVTANGGLALSGDGRVYVTGFGAEVWIFDAADGHKLGTLGAPGQGAGRLSQPVDVAVGAEGHVFVADAGSGQVEEFDAGGAHVRTIGRRGSASGQFSAPRSVAVDGEGRLLVGVGDDYIVQRFAPDGTYLDAFGEAHADENAWRVGGIAVDDAGRVYVSQALAGRIQCFAPPELHLAWELGQVGPGPQAFSSPLGLAVAGGKLYVADQSNHRVKVYALQP